MSILDCTESGFVIEIPRTFSRYQYIRTIGQGASSVVTLVEDTKTHQRYATKFVSRDMLEDENRIMYFERELRICQSLHHPNIVETREIVYLPKVIGVVMEYCPEGDLLSFLQSDRFHSLTQIRNIFYQLVQACAYLHERGYGHRDLKPENIFLTSDLRVKLGDLGLTKEAPKGCGLTSTICGTLYYTAPEVLAGEDYSPMKADVWSLGIILYALTIGGLPWTSTDQCGIETEILRGEVKIPPTVSLPIADVLHACLMKEPEKRASAQELLELPWMLCERPVYNRVFGKKPLVRNIRDCRTNPHFAFGEKHSIVKNIMHRPIHAVRSERLANRAFYNAS